MTSKSFTLDELVTQLKKDKSNITEEEAYCCVEIMVFEGYLRRVSQDIFERTDKEPPIPRT